MLITETTLVSPLQPSQPRYKTAAIVALEIIGGVALVAIGGYLAHMFGGVGTIGLIGIESGGGSAVAVLAIITIVCLRRKVSISPKGKGEVSEPSDNQKDSVSTQAIQITSTAIIQPTIEKKKLVTGRVVIASSEICGSLGTEIANLDCFDHVTARITTADGKDWKQRPEEMLIQCQISGLSKTKPPIADFLCVYLPSRLFFADKDYKILKKEGDIVVFNYKEYQYQLTIGHKENGYSFETMFELCLKTYNSNKGQSILPHLKDPVDDSRYVFPSDAKNEQDRGSLFHQKKEQFLQAFPEEEELSLDRAVEPKATFNEHGLKCLLENVKEENIRYFYTESFFALYVERESPFREKSSVIEACVEGIKVTSEEFLKHYTTPYFFMMDFDEVVTRSKVQQGAKGMSSGFLELHFD